MHVMKTFRYRLEPTKEQSQLFARIAGCCRYVFNRALAARIQQYESKQQGLSYFEQSAELTNLKKQADTGWLNVAPAQVLQQSLMDLQTAYSNFFRRVKSGATPGFPQFKKKGRKDSFRFPQKVRVRNGRVFLSKIGWVKYRDSRPVEGDIQQATVKREGEHWFVCILCRVDVGSLPAVHDHSRAVGIDIGLKAFAVLSTGEVIAPPNFLKQQLSKLRRSQRALSRKVRFSKNWGKHVKKVSRLHQDIKNRRVDFAHKLSTAIVKNHDVIAVEDISIQGLVQNQRLSRAISDAGWGRFISFLRYKAHWYGKLLVTVDRFFASSQLCSSCGARKEMPLSERTYECSECGLRLDRDLNASMNIRTAGLAVLGVTPNACGGVCVCDS